MFVSGSPRFRRFVALYAAILNSVLILSVTAKAFDNVASMLKNFGPARHPNCIGLVRNTYVFSGLRWNAAVLNHFCMLGLSMHGSPTTCMLSNRGKSPVVRVITPVSFQ